MRTGVLVAGFFDLLHSGHVCFLERAAEYGPLTVVIGSDQNALRAKGRLPLCTEEERLYMVQSLRVVERAVLVPDLGRLNFAQTMRSCQPRYFVTNADGHHPSKVELCRELEVEYVVLERDPHEGLPARSTTAWRSAMPNFPYKVALLGGFVDQPAIGRVCPASVVVVAVQTSGELDQRSGVATSTRNTAIGLFGPRYPAWMTPRRLAEIVFACENPPDRQYLSGTIDALGLFEPGISRLDYAQGALWPAAIQPISDDRILHWLEKHLWLVQTRPRPSGMPSPMDTCGTRLPNTSSGWIRRCRWDSRRSSGWSWTHWVEPSRHRTGPWRTLSLCSLHPKWITPLGSCRRSQQVPD